MLCPVTRAWPTSCASTRLSQKSTCPVKTSATSRRRLRRGRPRLFGVERAGARRGRPSSNSSGPGRRLASQQDRDKSQPGLQQLRQRGRQGSGTAAGATVGGCGTVGLSRGDRHGCRALGFFVTWAIFLLQTAVLQRWCVKHDVLRAFLKVIH